MKIVFIGPPGAGKGTAAQSLLSTFNLNHISTGDIIRNNISKGTPLGLQVKDILEQGELVSDDLMQSLIKATLDDLEAKNQGYILDGFPRTIPQTEWFVEHFDIDFYFFFDASKETIVDRISGRRIHQESGRIYHVSYAPPKVEGKDDVTGEAIVQRKDDQADKVLHRLEVYNEQTLPIIHYIKTRCNTHHTINAEQSETEITNDIIHIVNNQ